jgi:hypothetical protein
MTTTPFIDTVETRVRMAFTAAPSAPFLSPRPTQRPAAMAAASVTRTSSRARFRSGASGATSSESGRWEGCCVVIVVTSLYATASQRSTTVRSSAAMRVPRSYLPME